MPALDVSAVIATYQRPLLLRRCLEGLSSQTVAVREIVVVRRGEDEESASLLDTWTGAPLREVVVEEPGVVHALATGSRVAGGSVIAFTDDDAVPRADWIERLLGHFSDPSVGAVGGRDVLHTHERTLPLTEDVGRVTRCGKIVGNHHRGAGGARDVDVLKGVNMAFRRQALEFPSGLRGGGAQVNFEVAMCLRAREQGWRIVLDPTIVVDHFPGPRFGADRRGTPEVQAVRDAAYNAVAAVLSSAPDLFVRRALYGTLVGDIGSPGIARAAVGAVRGEQEAVRRLVPSLRGQIGALQDHLRHRRLRFDPVDQTRAAAQETAKRVVIIVPMGERLGGAENMLWTFLRHVDRGRVEPVVVFLQRGPFESEVRALGFRTLVLEAGRLRQAGTTLGVVLSLAGFLRGEYPDLVLNWMAKSQLYGAPAAALARMSDRVVWWQHLIPDGHWMDQVATRLPARAVGCSSHASAHAQRRQQPRRRTFVVHPGIESGTPFSREDVRALRRRLGIAEDSAVVGIVGRLQRWKGQDRFLHAVALLHERGHKVHGLVVGGDAFDLAPAYQRSLGDLARDLALSENVTFTGHVRHVEPYIHAMDVLVNASIGEPFGIVLLEAMAAGVPVVAVGSGGPTEIVEDERTGLLVETGDPVDLAGAIERLLQDESLRRRLAGAGRGRFQDSFTAQHMARRLQDELESLMQR
jgi:glycosyltransferase involved in cell wall biosynthesis